jgi:hypothetical protein
MRISYRWVGTVAVIVSVGHLRVAAGAEPASPRSTPPDQTPYVRPAVPEDVAPFGKPAIGPKIVPKGQERTQGLPLPDGTSGEKGKRKGEDAKPTPGRIPMPGNGCSGITCR